MEQRLSLVSLGVRDMALSRNFYEALGWQAAADASNEQITFFQLGGIILGLYGLQALADESNQVVGSGFGGISLAHNARTKEDVDQLLTDAVNAGATLLKPAEEVFWGGYSGYFADPDGYSWEISFNPFFPISDDGSVSLPV